ncbi:uncharacterized protein LOC135223301 [Macrobrachium nipponense]|uniref:uncharacterized protein LOC135223301 n=1 Tax=Macrobrachium nipponense TaxID=159736 RepID=UPI0030C8BDDA
MIRKNIINPLLLLSLVVSSHQNVYEDLGKPLHGEWSEWSPMSCSVTCGGGVAVQKRNCTEPSPSRFGRHCVGPANKTIKCNTHPCGELSYLQSRSILKSIREGFFKRKLETEFGEPLIVDCEGTMSLESHKKKWVKHFSVQEKFMIFDHNNTDVEFYISMKTFNSIGKALDGFGLISAPYFYNYVSGVKVLENGSLEILPELIDHGGLWMCAVNPVTHGKSYVISATPVLVKPNWVGEGVIHEVAGQLVTLSCNAQPLFVLFSTIGNFTMEWYHDGKLHKILQSEYLVLSNLSSSESGVWSCIVKENFTQITAYYHLVVHESEILRFFSFAKLSLDKFFLNPLVIDVLYLGGIIAVIVARIIYLYLTK